METRLLTQNEFIDIKDSISESVGLIYFEITSIGPNSIITCEKNSVKINELAIKQPGFYLIGANEEDLRSCFHNYIDQLFEARKNNVKQ